MKKEMTAEKSKIGKIKTALAMACSWAMIAGGRVAVFAGTKTKTGTGTGIAQIDNALSTIKGLFLGCIATIGLIILAKGIADTAQAYQQADSHGMYDGAKGIAAGAIMASISLVLSLLGLG